MNQADILESIPYSTSKPCHFVQFHYYANRFIDDVYKSIPDPDVVDLNWYPLITTLYKKLLDGACFYTEQGDGKWIKQCESLFSLKHTVPLHPLKMM
jgi:hypothetical protein